MTWMERLKKNEKGHGDGATKPTKPPHEILERPKHGGYKTYETPKNGEKGGFVGFVASPDSAFQKNEGVPAPDQQNGQKVGFVGFVAPLDSAFQKIDKPATAPDWTPPPPAPDPGPARLLALAMALCDRTGASEKERQDWHADIEQTPPGLRGGLYAHLLGQLPPAPKAMPPAVVAPPDPAKPLPKFHVAQPWNKADKAYQAHHWNCPTCKAAARSGHSDRCATGQQLHDLYERAFEAGKVSK